MYTTPKVNFYIGNDSFRDIQENHRYYVDKTGFIEEFLHSSYPQVALFTRPRRFGKTLTMTMLREFFDINAKNKNLFEGLYISKNAELCKKWQNQSPVIYLTLKEFNEGNLKDTFGQLSMILQELFLPHKYLLESDKVYAEDKQNIKRILNTQADTKVMANALKLLSRAFYCFYNKPIIILIDEYDVPINDAYHEGFYKEMIKFMRNFLGAALKGNEYLEFAVLTGCLRIAKESIFTGLNNFECFGISDDSFSTTFGFTSQEVDQILADADLEDKKPLFKEWYDGYTFGNNSEIYCPWDVTRYVNDLQKNASLEPKLYWNNTSGNDIIKDFLKRTDFEVANKFQSLTDGGCVEIPLSEQQTYNMLYSSEDNFWNILYATGYLTKANSEQIKHCGKKAAQGNCLLVIPNKEVLDIYKSSIREWLDEDIIRPERKNFLEAFWNGEAEKISEIISSVLSASMSCRDYYESFYHGALFGIFFGSGCKELSNRESGLGYYDLFIMHPIRLNAALIEIKRADSLGNLEKEANNALSQIEEKQYTNVTAGFKNILHWGIAFYQKRCVALVKKPKTH